MKGRVVLTSEIKSALAKVNKNKAQIECDRNRDAVSLKRFRDR